MGNFKSQSAKGPETPMLYSAGQATGAPYLNRSHTGVIPTTLPTHSQVFPFASDRGGTITHARNLVYMILRIWVRPEHGPGGIAIIPASPHANFSVKRGVPGIQVPPTTASTVKGEHRRTASGERIFNAGEGNKGLRKEENHCRSAREANH